MTTLDTAHEAAPSLDAGHPGLVSAVRGETTKATTLRSTWWCLALGLVALVGLPAILMTQGDVAPHDLATGAGLSLMVVMSMAAVLSTGDIAHGTVRVGRWAHPARWEGFLARVLTSAVLGGFVGLVGGAAVLGLAVLFELPSVGAAELQSTLGQAPVFAVACSGARSHSHIRRPPT